MNIFLDGNRSCLFFLLLLFFNNFLLFVLPIYEIFSSSKSLIPSLRKVKIVTCFLSIPKFLHDFLSLINNCPSFSLWMPIYKLIKLLFHIRVSWFPASFFLPQVIPIFIPSIYVFGMNSKYFSLQSNNFSNTALRFYFLFSYALNKLLFEIQCIIVILFRPFADALC